MSNITKNSPLKNVDHKSWVNFSKWLNTACAHAMLEAERQQIEMILPKISMECALQLVISPKQFFLRTSKTSLTLFLVPESMTHFPTRNCIRGDFSAIPIATSRMSLVIAQHSLELSNDPLQTLLELDRVLTDDGHLLLISANPVYSMLDVTHQLPDLFKSKAIQGAGAISQWLKKHHFEIHQISYGNLLFPVASSFVNVAVKSVNKISSMLNLPIGCFYIIHAQKRVGSLLLKPFAMKKSTRLTTITRPI